MIERMKSIKSLLMNQVEGQMANLKDIDAKELHYVIEAIENLSEAIYYCTITEAMEEEGEEKEGKGKHGMMYSRSMPMYHMPYPIEMYDPRYRERYNYGSMYAQNSGMNSGNSSSNGGSEGSMGTRGYHEGMMPMEDHWRSTYPMHERDPREGKSGERRKMYMEGKGMKDKAWQMKELEAYMQELSTDLTEMIQDASPEEKQMLQQKISTLATKIK